MAIQTDQTDQTDPPPAAVDGRRLRGERTRRTILEAAARLASVEGLEGLSIGRLAAHLGISKSGLYAHFESKEELQLAAIRMASEMYERDVVGPALEAQPGVGQLIGFVDAFFDYVQHGPFPGGCFFIASYLDPANLRGRVRALLAEEQQGLLDFMADCVRTAQELGEMATRRPPEEIAFEVDAILAGADVNYMLFDAPRYLELGRASVRRLLDSERPAA
ncbi:MAG: TetR/AcrR family transcriptional regulator [Candidatus Limnocylindria bacterium]